MSVIKNLKAKEIETKKDFVKFLRELENDYLENPSSWDNKNIGAFLGAMASWVEDMGGFYINNSLPIPEKIDWKIFADILMGGKLYE